jgi:hypothetical protein
MGLISSALPGFTNGISQQPYSLRLNTQGEAQENGISTISQGLKKRPPSIHLAKIMDGPLSDTFIHTINRDDSERYIVFVKQGELKIFTIDGIECPVTYEGNAQSYLTTSIPVAQSFSAVTIADYTWLVNKNIIVQPTATTTAARPHPYEALVNVKSGNYGKNYNIKIDGNVVASFTTPNGSSADQSPQIATDYIAAELCVGLQANRIPCIQSGNSIYIYKDDVDFTIEVNDGFGNNAMVVIKDRTQRFSDLPTNPRINGVVVEIVGDASSTFDNYFVRFECDDSGSGGVWREAPKPGIPAGTAPDSMPHLLIRNADGSFTLKAGTWRERKVGDLISNPDPSFVGRTISEVFFYQNRVGYLSDENVIMSESGSYFNNYRTTVTTIVDSDVIDVTAAHTKVALLNYAIPYNKSLILFSEQTQFVIPADTILSPTTIAIKVSTEYPCDVNVKPISAGRNCYFSITKGNYTALREYYTDVNNVGDDATEITAHIPRYIPSGGFKLASSTAEDTFAYLTKGDPNSIYMYKYFFTSSNEKAQSSWSRWSFAPTDTILNVDFIQSVMYVIINRADGVYLEKIDCSLGYIGNNEPYAVLLDRKLHFTPTIKYRIDKGFDAGKYVTQVPISMLPYKPDDGIYQIVTGTEQRIRAGEFIEGKIVGDNIEFLGDFTGCNVAFGRQYEFKYQLSPITVKTTAGGMQKSDTEGRLQLRKVAFNYANTGYMKIQVTPVGRQTNEYVFAGRIIGNNTATIGDVELPTGRFPVPILTRNTNVNITVVNDSPVPSGLISADWEGFYVKRSQGV